MTGLEAIKGPETGETVLALRSGASAGPGVTATIPARVAARPGVAVIVCTFTEDRWDDLARAIRSVQAQSEPAADIILVVDHCQPLLHRARPGFPGVRVIPNHYVKGLAGARNAGMEAAGADIVAFLDDDAAADPDWIARLVDAYHDARVLGVGGLVRPMWDAGRPSWFPPELDWAVGCTHPGLPAAGGRVRNFIGANMSFRREVFDHVAGFSLTLGRVGYRPLGGEETELCLRIGERYPEGLLIYQPAAAVSHRVGRQRARWGYLWARCYSEGLSKATVANLAGPRRALASELSYVRSQVPRALARAAAGAARGKLAGLLTAVALVGAVMMAAAGYLAGKTGVGWRGEAGAFRRLARWADSPAVVPWVGLSISVTLWGASLAQASTGGVTTSGLGLIPALPVTFWAATGLLVLSFCFAVMRPATRVGVLAGHLAVLVAFLHATPAILYGTLRYSWAWKHIGVVDFISHHGIAFNLGGILGPYQGWPGFFALNSFLTTGGGQSSALSYASWALPVNDLLWLGPIILISRAFTSDRRLIWAAAWLFELGNWVGQDYFSPQAFTFFLYLAVLAVCLRWLWSPRALRPRRRDGRRARSSGPAPATMRAGWRMLTRRAGIRPDLTQTVPAGPLLSVDLPPMETEDPLPDSVRFALIACMFPLLVAIASSHQLTPFMLVAALTVLAVFRQVRPILLPVLMAAITIDWILYGARPWLTANSAQILAGLGMPLGNTSAHLVGGTQVPFDQVIVEWGARLLSAAIAFLAIAGFFRYRRYHYGPARRSWNRTALLGVAAIPSVAANSYGGEIIFRAFLFALPFMAVTAAATFFPHPAIGRGIRAGLALAAVSLTLAGGFILANYGSEAINYFTPREVSAAQWLYRTAPKGAEVVAANSNFPWAFVHYNSYTYGFLDSPPALSRAVVRDPVTAVTRIMKQDHGPAYLILTVSQEEQESLTGTWPPGTVARITRDLLASGRYRVAFRNSDAVVMQLSQAANSHQHGAGR